MSTSDYFWPDEFKNILKQAYQPGGGGLAAAAAAIPSKKKGTIAVEAHRMGLTKPRPRKPKGV